MAGLADSSGDRTNSIKVEGDRNQSICQNFGTAIGNIQGDVNFNQQPKFLSLHQLPSDTADFTGRTTEIETIRQQLLGGKSLVISAVAGMAGVGKSALAIHVAQQLAAADYPDVQLYVDLRGADGDGLEPGEVLARWLRAFGLDESNMPIDLQERASVYRSQLAGQRAIVLLDNAMDEAQVRPLLPGNGCAVIITSRRVLGALDGATVLNLKVLSAVNWAKVRERWNTVISFAASLGLFFQARSYWQDWEKTCLMAVTAAREVDDLAEEGQSLNRLGIVYKSQSRWGEALKCFQQSLSIFRELRDRHAEGQSLNNLGMVYRVQSRWGEAIECFQQSLSIFRELRDRYGEGKSLNNLGNVYKSQSRWEDAIDCYQQSLTIKQELCDRHGESASLNNLGNVYESQSRWEVAIYCYEQSLTIYREFGDRHGEGTSLNNLGVMYLAQHRWKEATECFQQSLTIYREFGNRYGEAQTLGNLGLLYAKQGQLDLAILLWQEALTKLPEGAAEYQIFQGWLETARHPATKASKQPILLLIIGAIVAILLMVNLVLGHWIVAVVILGLAIGFWLLLRIWIRRSRCSCNYSIESTYQDSTSQSSLKSNGSSRIW